MRHQAFELAAACVFILVGAGYLTHPDATLLTSPVAHHVGYVWVYAWSLLYVAAGPAIIYGVLAQKANHRLAGLVLLATALVMNGTAAVTAPGLEPRDFTYYIYAAACLLRACLVVRTNPRG